MERNRHREEESTKITQNIVVPCETVGTISLQSRTSSSAVAERLPDVSYLSIVSVNSAVFYYYYYRLQIYHCIQLNAALLSLA